MANILIVFSSLFGTNLKAAQLIQASLEKNEVRVRIRRTSAIQSVDASPSFLSNVPPEVKEIPVASNEDMEWADAYVFSSPTHSSMISASMKFFLDMHHDQAAEGKYMNKPFTAVTTTAFQHAGDEEVIEQLYDVAQHWGCLIVSVSITNAYVMKNGGNPYGLSFVVDDKGQLQNLEEIRKLMDLHFTRFAEITKKLAGEQLASSPVSKAPKAYNIVDAFNK